MVDIVLLKQVTIVDILLQIVQSYFFVKHDLYHNAASDVITVICCSQNNFILRTLFCLKSYFSQKHYLLHGFLGISAGFKVSYCFGWLRGNGSDSKSSSLSRSFSPVSILLAAASASVCKVFLPVSLVVHNTLRSVGERCEMVHKLFVRVLLSSRVIFVFHRNCPQ